MQRIRVIWLACAVTLAVSVAVTSGATAALPEFVPLKGAGAFPVAFSSQHIEGLVPTLQTVGGTKIECAKDSSLGEIANAKEVHNMVITYKECKSSIGGECTTGGQPKGTIVTKSLIGRFEYLKKTSPIVVGLILSPGTGTIFAELACGTSKAVIASNLATFGLIGAFVSTINVTLPELQLDFNQESGFQEFTEFENEAKEIVKNVFLKTSINGGTSERTGLFDKHLLKLTAEEGQIKA